MKPVKILLTKLEEIENLTNQWYPDDFLLRQRLFRLEVTVLKPTVAVRVIFSFSHGLRVLMQRLKVEYNVTVNIDATLPQFDDHNSDISDYQRLIDDRFEN